MVRAAKILFIGTLQSSGFALQPSNQKARLVNPVRADIKRIEGVSGIAHSRRRSNVSAPRLAQAPVALVVISYSAGQFSQYVLLLLWIRWRQVRSKAARST